MDLSPEVSAKLIERAKLIEQIGAEAAMIIPELIAYIGTMKTRLDAAMRREAEWKAKVAAATAALEENAALRKQMDAMLDHPDVRANKVALLAQQIERLQGEQVKLLRAKLAK